MRSEPVHRDSVLASDGLGSLASGGKRVQPTAGVPTCRAAPRNGGRWRRAIRRFVLRLVKLRGSPEAIALGLAIGVFVAFTPTVGFQMVIAAFLATVLNANPTAAAAAVWITNPATIPPIYAATYWLGSLVWPGPPVEKVYGVMADTVQKLARREVWEMYGQLKLFVSLGRSIFIPMLIGGVLVGLAGGSLVYVLTLRIVRARRQRRKGRRTRSSWRKTSSHKRA